MKRILLYIICCLLSFALMAQTAPEIPEQYLGLGLPMICITTVDGEEPTSTGIMHPEGFNGASITDVVAKEARMKIFRDDTLWYDSGEYLKDEAGIKIKHRGNTSAYCYENKPFKLKLQKKADLIDFHEECDTVNRKSKDWVLLNCSFSIRTAFVYQVEKIIEMEYAPRVEYVNVFINNDYRGIYILSENVKRDKDCRVDVDKDEGYIIELNAYFWNETYSIPSKLTGFLQWTLKYPDVEDLTEEMEANIRSDISRLETSVSNDDYPEVIDVRSVARWILLHDIVGTYDPAGCNIFVARKNQEASSLMRMPVAWDMDSSMLYPKQWSRTHTELGLFFSRLFANEKCQDFLETYVDEWNCVSQSGVMERMRQVCQAFPSTPQGQGLARSYPLHAIRWGFDPAIFDVEAFSQSCYEWFVEREPWLNDQISELADGIRIPSVAERRIATRKVIQGRHLYIIKDGKTYSPDGKRVK